MKAFGLGSGYLASDDHSDVPGHADFITQLRHGNYDEATEFIKAQIESFEHVATDPIPEVLVNLKNEVIQKTLEQKIIQKELAILMSHKNGVDNAQDIISQLTVQTNQLAHQYFQAKANLASINTQNSFPTEHDRKIAQLNELLARKEVEYAKASLDPFTQTIENTRKTLAYFKDRLKGKKDRDGLFQDLENNHRTIAYIWRKRWKASKELSESLYHYNLWKIESYFTPMREEVFIKLTPVARIHDGQSIVEEHYRQGSKTVQKIYEESSNIYGRLFPALGADYDLMGVVQNYIKKVYQITINKGHYEESGTLGKIHNQLKDAPFLAYLNYVKFRVGNMDKKYEADDEELYLSHKIVLLTHEPVMNELFLNLYPGAMLYKLFVTDGILSESLFPEFIKNLQDMLGWELPY